jgi:hypothetical protein
LIKATQFLSLEAFSYFTHFVVNERHVESLNYLVQLVLLASLYSETGKCGKCDREVPSHQPGSSEPLTGKCGAGDREVLARIMVFHRSAHGSSLDLGLLKLF